MPVITVPESLDGVTDWHGRVLATGDRVGVPMHEARRLADLAEADVDTLITPPVPE